MPTTNEEVLKLVRPDIKGMTGYSASSPEELIELTNSSSYQELGKLDSCEMGTPPKCLRDLPASKLLERIHLYGDAKQLSLRQKIAQYLNDPFFGEKGKDVPGYFTADHVCCGNGSDESLTLLMRLFATEEIILPIPTFGMYKIAAGLEKIPVISSIDRTSDFSIDTDRIRKHLRENNRPSIIFLASPNNPTGNQVSESDLRVILEAGSNHVVVLDEAYTEASTDCDALHPLSGQPGYWKSSLIHLIPEYPNLVVTRTFSKFAGMAGMRIGYSVQSQSLTSFLVDVVKAPYNLNVVGELLASTVLDNFREVYENEIRMIQQETLCNWELLKELDLVSSVPPAINYPWIFLDASKVGMTTDHLYQEFLKEGLVIRVGFSGQLHTMARVSTSKPIHNQKFRHVLKRLLGVPNYAPPPSCPRSTFKHLLLDMDGVLADVHESFRQCIIETGKHFGKVISPELIAERKLQGNANNDWVLTHEILVGMGLELEFDQVKCIFENYYHHGGPSSSGSIGLKHREKLIPAQWLIPKLFQLTNGHMAIVTGRPVVQARYFLDINGLLDYFPVIVGMEDAPPKPSPLPIFKAIERLTQKFGNIFPQDCVMVGDTMDDVRSAISSGVCAHLVLTPKDAAEETYFSKPATLRSRLPEGVSVYPAGLTHLIPLFDSLEGDESLAGLDTFPHGTHTCRKTKETCVTAAVGLHNPKLTSKISSKIGFLDHMLDQLSKHSGIPIFLECRGDLWIDDHHSIEDCGLALGTAFDKGLGERQGIQRFGMAHVPLDEALARVIVDISSRPFADINFGFSGSSIGQCSTQMLTHFLESFASNARITLHLDVLKGKNDHHRAECGFKALAVALKMACTPSGQGVPSTKGVL